MFKASEYGLFLRLHGKVQGVGLRKAIKSIADVEGVNGFVWNHVDGSVCLVIVATQKKLSHFQAKVIEKLGNKITTQQTKTLLSAELIEADFKGFEIIKNPFSAGKNARFLLEASDESWHLATDEQQAITAFKELIREYEDLSNSTSSRVVSALQELSKRFPKGRTELRQLFAAAMPTKFFPHSIVSQPTKYDGLSGTASLRELMILRTRKQHIMPRNHAHEWAINNKLVGYEFAKALGVATPKVKEKTYTVPETPKLNDKVIKPLSGKSAIGVFLMRTPTDIVEVATGKAFNSFSAMKERMKKLLASNQVREDTWIVEELIYGDKTTKVLPIDLKFLCFYGKVVLVREIHRYPKPNDCWWKAPGEQVDVGISFENPETLQAVGVTKEMIAQVEGMSKQIPVPFIRLDFLLADGELVLNEITPRPGSFANFNDTYDRILGDQFLKAESRLTNDLLNGASFKQFKKITGLSK